MASELIENEMLISRDGTVWWGHIPLQPIGFSVVSENRLFVNCMDFENVSDLAGI